MTSNYCAPSTGSNASAERCSSCPLVLGPALWPVPKQSNCVASVFQIQKGAVESTNVQDTGAGRGTRPPPLTNDTEGKAAVNA